MCDPVTATLIVGGFAASSAASVASYSAQSQAAEAQGSYQNTLYKQTARAARENYTQQINQSGLRITQEADAGSQQSVQNSVASGQALGSAITSAGESGVMGNSVDQLFLDYGRIKAANDYTLGSNIQGTRQQMGQELLAIRAGNQNRITDRTPAPVALPSLLATGLSIAAQGLSTADLYAYRQGSGVYGNKKA